MKTINRAAIVLQIYMLAESAWRHQLDWSIFWATMILANAAYHWRTLPYETNRQD